MDLLSKDDMRNMFSRMEMIVGPKALAKLWESKVAVFGIGGVGSHAVEGLARAGVGNLVLVDDDCVCMTNINRQIHATIKTIGIPKVEAMKDRILEINPNVKVETHRIFFMPGESDDIIDDSIDYIIDAVDTVTAKIHLAVMAKEKGIPIISSMGTGNKLNPAMLEATDISKTSVDPLARVMRKELRERGITSLKVVYSRETPIKPGIASCNDNCVCCGDIARKCIERRNIPGSVSFVPPVAGFIIAGEVVKDLISAE
jgi:tRNA A37 threonylcarbamoyladenosine dehydratase